MSEQVYPVGMRSVLRFFDRRKVPAVPEGGSVFLLTPAQRRYLARKRGRGTTRVVAGLVFLPLGGVA